MLFKTRQSYPLLQRGGQRAFTQVLSSITSSDSESRKDACGRQDALRKEACAGNDILHGEETSR